MQWLKNRKWLAIVHYMKPDDEDTIYTTTFEVEGEEMCDALDRVYEKATMRVDYGTWRKYLVRSLELLESIV